MTPGSLDRLTLVELQAALRAGAGPAEALSATCRGGILDDVASQARLGRSLSEVAAAVDTGDAAANFLVRCLALTERTGGGAAEAVEHALTAIRDELDLARLVDVRTAQARGTAVILTAIPAAAWVFLVALDRRTLAFYATPLGAVTGGVAVCLSLLAWRWMRRLIAVTATAGAAADPLASVASTPAWRRGLLVGVPAGLVAGTALGPVAGVAATAAVTLARARRRGDTGAAGSSDATGGGATSGGAAETVSLLAVALDAGMSPATAFAEVAAVAPHAAAPMLRSAARRTTGGWSADESLADTPLATVGATIAAAQRWGAPAVPALRALAADLRADRRAAVEVAAERLQLALIFPTTLLTLPAFVLGVVPPLLWSTLRA